MEGFVIAGGGTCSHGPPSPSSTVDSVRGQDLGGLNLELIVLEAKAQHDLNE